MRRKRKRKHTKWYILLTLLAVVVCLLVFGSMYAEQRREAAFAKFKLPESAKQFQALMEAVARDTPAEEAPEAAAEASSLPRETIDAARVSLDAYAALATANVARLDMNEEWNSIRREFPEYMSDWTPEQWAHAEVFFKEHAGLLEEIRRLAAQGGPFYPLDFSKGPAIDLQHLGPVRNFARLLRVEAGLHARGGNWEQAVANIIAQTQLAGALGEEPILISQLVSFAINGIASQTLEEIAPPGTLNQKQSIALIRAFTSVLDREQMAAALAMETRIFTPQFDQILRDDVSDLTGISNPVVNLLASSTLGHMLVSLNEATYLELMTPLVDLAHLPYYEAVDGLGALEREAEDLPFYLRLASPSLTSALLASARNEARIDLLRMGLTLEQHYATHGAYPATLDEITGQLGGVPIDPFTGDAYHYIPSGNTFTLYSVGQNLEDDGGLHHLRDADIVWRGRQE